MRTRLDLMSECVDALSRSLTDNRFQGNFVPLGDGRIELRINVDVTTAETQFAALVDTVTLHLWRVHRIDPQVVLVEGTEGVDDRFRPRDLLFTDDIQKEKNRLPLRFVCRNLDSVRLAPVLSVTIG